MIPALDSLKGLIKQKSYHIDHTFFRLHYRVTVCLLLSYCILLTAKILFGDVMDCKSRTSGRDDYFDNWCYSRGTYTEYVLDQKAYERAINRLLNGTSNSANTSDNLSSRHATRQIVVTTTEEPNIMTRMAEEGLRLLFNEADKTTPMPPEAEPAQLDRPTFPLGFLKDTDFGDALKDQFRWIHKFVKNSGVPFSPDIVYIIPGVSVPNGSINQKSLTLWHTYYQYIPIILFMQAVFFYFPHYLWKTWENGDISSVCKQIHENRFSPVEYFENNYHIIDYLQNSLLRKRSLVFKYYFCHLLLLVNLIVQIIMLNVVFNNQFVTYGMDVLQYLLIDEDIYGFRDFFTNGPGDLNNPMDFVFPKVTTCRYVVLSSAGKIPDVSQFGCVLPLNIFNDKFFIILWFWFLILTAMSVLQIIFDVTYCALPMLRRYLFVKRFGPILVDSHEHPSSLSKLFILDIIGTNSDPFAFSALLKKLIKEEWHGTAMEHHSLV